METRNTKEDKRWESIMENLDLLFAKVSDMDKNQQKLEASFDMSTRVVEQMLRDQQNGKAN